MEQATVFDALNYNPYDDDVNDQFDGTYHSVAMPNYSYKLSFEDMAAYPVDYGICDEEREAEIKAGSPLTSLEKQLIDDKILSTTTPTSLSINSQTGMKRCSD